MQHLAITDCDCHWPDALPTEKMNFIKNQYEHSRVFKLQIEASTIKKPCAKRVKRCGLITKNKKCGRVSGGWGGHRAPIVLYS